MLASYWHNGSTNNGFANKAIISAAKNSSNVSAAAAANVRRTGKSNATDAAAAISRAYAASAAAVAGYAADTTYGSDFTDSAMAAIADLVYLKKSKAWSWFGQPLWPIHLFDLAKCHQLELFEQKLLKNLKQLVM